MSPPVRLCLHPSDFVCVVTNNVIVGIVLHVILDDDIIRSIEGARHWRSIEGARHWSSAKTSEHARVSSSGDICTVDKVLELKLWARPPRFQREPTTFLFNKKKINPPLFPLCSLSRAYIALTIMWHSYKSEYSASYKITNWIFIFYADE